MLSQVYRSIRGASRYTSSKRFCGSVIDSWDYDVIVVGGGVVGSSFAALLNKKMEGNIKICIVEPSPPPDLVAFSSKPNPDVRVYALSPKSVSILQSIGAWEFMKERMKTFQSMQIWDSDGFVQFSSIDAGVESLGTCAEDCTLQAAIFESIKAESNGAIDTIFNAKITDISTKQNFLGKEQMFNNGPAKVTIVKLSSNEKKTISARLVVGADGTNSVVKKLAGLATISKSYGQDAVVATVALASGIDTDTAWQRYLPEGPLALLPLWGGYASIVWSCSPHTARSLVNMTPENFIANLNDALQAGPAPPSGSSPLDILSRLIAPKQGPLASAYNNLDSWSGFSDAPRENGSSTSSSTESSPRGKDELDHFFSFMKRSIVAPVRAVRREARALISDAFAAATMLNMSSSSYPGASGSGVSNSNSSNHSGESQFRRPPLVGPSPQDANIVGDKTTTQVAALASPRVSFPLQISNARSYVSHRVALIGDSAHTIHPQAGQGLNLGLQDVSLLVDVLVDAVAAGADIGDVQVLNNYNTASQVRNLAMLGVVDTINMVFSIGNTAVEAGHGYDHHNNSNGTTIRNVLRSLHLDRHVAVARTLGMRGIQSSKVLKTYIAKYAMGLHT